jgi:hypothetical protein
MDARHPEKGETRVRTRLIPPLSLEQLAEKGLEESINSVDSAMEVFQFRPEADSYLILYKFSREQNSWRLTLLRDSSL